MQRQQQQNCHYFLTLFLLLASFSLCFGAFKEDQIALAHGKASSSVTTHRGLLSGSSKVVNVNRYGAKGNGQDDSKAFLNAWKVACSTKGATLLVPEGRTYLLKPMNFSGPCKSGVSVKIYGTIKASKKMSDYEEDRKHWLVFENIQNLNVKGRGTINGNGRTWWEKSCKVNESLPCTLAPNAVTFYECNNLRVSNLRFKDAQMMHVSFQRCNNVRASRLWVNAPGDSPNTDGIHVTGTQNIVISNSVIKTGDDCISIVNGSINVQALDITCGPGHGISIGSLGANNVEAQVSNVMVNRAKLTGTTNGVRIKTWQGGSGHARNILFQNLVMRNVSNPIIINQNYCDQNEPCKEQKSAVQVSKVVYKNIKGTSATEEAITFDCSKSFPCKQISLQDVRLVGYGDERVKASCQNVKLSNTGKVSPRC